MTRLAALMLLWLPACSKNPSPTAVGATVLDWKLSQSDRVSIRSAKRSEPSKKSVAFTAEPSKDTKVQLALDVELATVTFEEDGQQTTHTAPVALSGKVVDGADFTLGPAACQGPHYQLAAPGQAPREMVLMCTLRAKKPNVDALITVTLYGDGRVER